MAAITELAHFLSGAETVPAATRHMTVKAAPDITGILLARARFHLPDIVTTVVVMALEDHSGTATETGTGCIVIIIGDSMSLTRTMAVPPSPKLVLRPL